MNLDFTKPRKNQILSPWQVTGLTDGEGGFNCTILNTGTRLTGKTVKLEFKVTQKSHSEGILLELKEFFGCGSVVIDNRKTDTKKYHVTSLSDILNKVIPHFDSYPCLTSKHLNYRDWKQISILMERKEHLTIKGIENIIKLASKKNKQRSFEDKFNYCNSFLGIERLNGEIITNYDLPANWVQTYLTGESMFYVYVSEKKSRGKTYQGCDPSLELGQNNHDVAILLSLKKFFDGGYIKPKYNYMSLSECQNSRSVNRFIFRNTASIIEFVDKYPMLTRKNLDYIDWKQIVELKNMGAHKTVEGLTLIKNIISRMNSRRLFGLSP